MDLRSATKEIRGGQVRPVYVLYGKERYRMQEFVTFLTDQLLNAEEKELGIVKYDTAETLIQEAVLEAETLPFFAARKIILIRDQTLLAAGKESKLEHQPDRLLDYLKEPCETSTIVFLVQADKLDERRKLVKRLKELDVLLMFQELEGNDLLRWMIKRAQTQGRELDEGAAELIMMRCGHNLQQISQEVDKLCLYVGEGGKIGRNEADTLTIPSVEEDVFALVDAMASFQTKRALELYKQLLLRKEEPIKIVALMARQFRIMLQIKELEGYQYTPQQIGSNLGLHPYVVKLAAEKARRYEASRLAIELSRLAELDYHMKTGQIDKVLGVELFLLRMGA
ncbi:DNA polymerase III subunit delta [Paenibacillus sp. GCM10012307]|uniref:DNA polymerase III subunit delta n=1 Tax=Paenibacillus roseus TaxID=2798579 RepID=A0A934J7J5_9BACL|nr:DNA polymerase III subunit delta [Paenibacillus roseus]MBJ6363078.1 DNA polymerase III subunit delta [Paenibacillus roseus]